MSTMRVEQQLEELDDGTWALCPPKEDSRRDVDLPPFLSGLLARQVAATQAARVPECSCFRDGGESEPHHGGTFVFTGRTTRRRDAKKKLVPVTAAHWRRSGFESMIFKPAAEAWYPKKAPRPRRPVPIEADPFPGIPVRGRNYVERSTACWVPIADGLTPHLLRHTHKAWMNEDRIDLKLAYERLGHEMGGVGAVQPHHRRDASGAMRGPDGAVGRRARRPPGAVGRVAGRRPGRADEGPPGKEERRRERRRFHDRPTEFPQRDGCGTTSEAPKAGLTLGGAEGI
ncbi:site-specific integrase [Actinomadura soli]|uniref:hypothetical protein n=1 Tax=Actinomadura soli TaxID=2508997 RepID=UPI00197AA068|nr:hypothetical protein [Actinomadura soli]